jgi:PleD family two-component response regulator
MQVSASIGLALSTPRHTTPEALLRDADTALYRAKGQQGDCVVISRPLSTVTRLSVA